MYFFIYIMKQQVIFINGSVPKENYTSYYEYLESVSYDPYEEKFLNWNKTLGEKLWDSYEFLKAPISSEDFADYEAWKICFEKMFPYLRDDCIFIVTSLWGTFILKYMIETGFPQSKNLSISKIFFLAAALHDSEQEKLGSFSFDTFRLWELQNIAKHIYIYHSRDDEIVDFSESKELFSYFPDAIFREFTDKGHFYKEAELPEIVKDIKA